MTQIVTEPEIDPEDAHWRRCPARSDFEDDGHRHVIADHYEDVSVAVDPLDYGAAAPPRCETPECTTDGGRGRWRLVIHGAVEEMESWTYCTPHVGPAFLDAIARIETGRLWESG